MKIKKVLNNDELVALQTYFNAANYLSVGQLYLLDNPLLQRPLELKDIKYKLVGHWGTVPGQNFIWTHLNRIIKKYDLNMIYLSGPGHGGNSQIANTYLEGSYTEVYPNITTDYEGLKKLFKQFSFPGGVPSHDAPETPGSIHEGGELGYSLSHAFGAVLDNPTLIAATVVGDGEAETGPLATSWNINRFINPKKDGVVLPIVHLNGYKIANPTILGRMNNKEVKMYFKGLGWNPIIVEGKEVYSMHEKMARALEYSIKEINKIKDNYDENDYSIPRWPMIVLRTPKGWTGPKVVDGKKIEGSFRAHQIPMLVDSDHLGNLKLLENWLKSYHPEQIWNKDGTLKDIITTFVPKKDRRMGSNPVTNGGLLLKELNLPDFRDYKIDVKSGSTVSEDTKVLSNYLRDVVKNNPDNFRIFGPDEALSNRLNHVFEVTNRQWLDEIIPTDDFLSRSGQVIDSYLSEHFCEGALEGYILTGRHGFFHSYEAFIRIVDSMVSQHAKWIKISNDLTWRKDISSLNFLLSSHVWQQDHNGFTHQDPGFLNHLVTKKADTVRMYLPFDANSLLSCFDHCIKTKNYINVVIASKHPSKQWLNMEDTIKHCTKGIGRFDFASNDTDDKLDIVLACCGDVPTLETVAATTILRKFYKNLKIRVVNVVDLMKLESNTKHPHGLTDEEFYKLFPKDKHVIFAFHGYPSLIHQLIYKRENSENFHVHGYKEEGTITTAFDMRVQNHLDRYHLVLDALKYLNIKDKDKLVDYCNEMLLKHHDYIREYGKDMEEVTTWDFEEAIKEYE